MISAFAGASSISPPATILVVGGNGFIGAATTSHLIHQGYDVVMANRNSTYFDNGGRVSKAKHIYWDRRLPLDASPEVKVSKCLDFEFHQVSVLLCVILRT